MFNGSGKLYSPAGELLFEGNFANNMAINENKPISVKYYSLNGELRKEIRYKDIEYYTDGKKKYEGEYWKDPKRYHSHEYWDGQGKEYYPSGKLKYEGVFYEGRIVSGKAYFENGKLCAEGVFAKSGRSPASVPNKLFSDRDISDSLVLRSGRRYYKSGRLWMEIQEEKKESRYIHPDTGKESNWPYNEGKIFSPTGSLLFSGKIRDEKPCVVGNFIKMELWDEDEQKFSIENGNMYERILN
jgi:antitoxin component YwqK of YwqJK toxin-antitoxin module